MTEDQRTICGFRICTDLKPLSGGEGTVFKAVCEELRVPGVRVGDTVALKVVSVQDDDGSRYEKLEARIAELVGLTHPNVVRYYGSLRERGPFSDVHVVVEEFVEGRPLKDLIAESRFGLDADDALRLASGIAEALDFVSERGIVHRDVKPANVIVTPDGVPKLIDFGVSKRESAGGATVGGNMIGTFDYMAPEFVRPDFRGDVVSDVFSFGVMVHEMVTGRVPYRQASTCTTCDNFSFLRRWSNTAGGESPLHLSRRIVKLTDGLDSLLRRLLSLDRNGRPVGFREVVRALGDVTPRVLFHRGDDGVERIWRLQTVVGRGGFGEVYKARDAESGELVAVKRLLGNDVGDRFRREARTMARLRDCCLTRFVDYFRASGGVGDFARGDFIVMEFLPGMPGASLRDAIRRKAGAGLDRSAVLHAFARYAHALGMLHHDGIIHRDIKPANLYFPEDAPDRAVVMDLGIARDLKGTVTAYGQLPGTVAYMPPEAIFAASDTETGRVNARGGPEGDVWALGLCLYEALTGRTAFPPLPDGNSAFVEFYRRSESRSRPDFSGVADDKEVLELLGEMCELDPQRRLRCAAAIERRLLELNGEAIDESLLAPLPADGELATADANSVSRVEDPETMATVCVGLGALGPDADFPTPSRRWRIPALAALSAIALGLAAVGISHKWRTDRADPMPAILDQAMKDEAAALMSEYDNLDVPVEALDSRFAVWVANWCGESRTAVEFGPLSNAVASAAAQRRRKDADADRLAREEAERLERENAERRRLAQEEAERLAREKAERVRLEKAAAEKLRLAREKSERERLEQERLARESAERERISKESAERLAREKAERARLEKERLAREKAERDRIARESAARLAKEEADRQSEAVRREIAQLDADWNKYLSDYEREFKKRIAVDADGGAFEFKQRMLVEKRGYERKRKGLMKKLESCGRVENGK